MKYLAKRYGKTAIACLVLGATALQAALSDDTVTPQEWLAIAIVALGPVGVFFAPYIPARPPAP